jgi:hypothetical protein
MTAPSSSTAAARARSTAAAVLRGRAQEVALPLVVVVLVIVGTVLKGTIFFSTANLWNVLVQASVAGTVAVGMTFVIATGGIDLAVGSVLAAAAIIGGHYTARSAGSCRHDASTAVAFGGQRPAVAGLRIVPFVATLAMLAAARIGWQDQPQTRSHRPEALTRSAASACSAFRSRRSSPVVVALAGSAQPHPLRLLLGSPSAATARPPARRHPRAPSCSRSTSCRLCTGTFGPADRPARERVAGGRPGLELDAIAAVVIGGTSPRVDAAR